METSNNRITINIGGVRFETYCNTLQRFPGTKLSSLTEQHSYSTYDYDPKLKEFFFDRNATVFGCVLEYYRTGHLHFPGDICRSVLVEELAFWEINDTQLAHCCWLKLNSKDSHLEDFNVWDENNQTNVQGLIATTERIDFSWRARWQPKIWAAFKMPATSVSAMCVALVSLLFTIGAIVLFLQETKKQFVYQVNITLSPHTDIFTDLSGELAYSQASHLLFLELLCVLWFIAEFSLRLFSCPDKRTFLKNPMNIIDFVSLFPVFIELCATGYITTLTNLWIVLGFMRITYIIKLLRFFKLIESGLIIRVLAGTLRSIVREIFILLLILVFEILFFGTLMFYAELYIFDAHLFENTHYADIHSALWWAVVTLTTVGYGDIYPISTFGKVVAAMTAMSGILTIVIPIPILMIKFQHYYSVAMANEKLRASRQKPSH